MTPAKTFFDGERASSLSYLFKADGPADIRIDVVSKDTGEVIDSVVKRNQKPFANYTAGWDGLLESGGIAGDGDYRFRVSQLSGGAGASAKFSFYDHIFPLRGKHSYGDGLGSGRGHEGQDVFAKCGTKIVAARGGRVQVSEYHSAAGYYVVVDGAKTGKDYMYAHMEKAGRPKVGDEDQDRRGDRLHERHRPRQRLPPALRALVSARLVRGRARAQPDEAAEGLG